MKFNLSILVLAVVPVLLMATPAAAQRHQDAINVFPVGAVRDDPEFTGQTSDIRFYFAGERHPGIVRRVQNNATTSQRARKSGRAADWACNRALMNALIRLGDAARNSGANAVINIRSNWDNRPYANGSEYECAIGRMMAGVALKGDIVTLR
jgi:uncharacterized protein YbjQ (UPF0145 family)